MKLYGTNFSSSAVTPSFSQADGWAEFVQSLGMNAVRLLWGYRNFIQQKPAEFLYFIYVLKQHGIKLVLPARTLPPNSFTDPAFIADELAWIDWLYGMNNPWTQTTVGQEVVLCEIANETGVWKTLKPLNWSTLTTTGKKAQVLMAAQIEADYFGAMATRLRQYIPATALMVGSQSNYQFQSNTLDGTDSHLYVNQQAPSGSGPWTFDNRNLLDDAGCYPISLLMNRKPGKPHGITEYNDTGASYHYHTNLLLMIYAAAIQGCDWLLHYQMGQTPERTPGHIQGNCRDDEHLGKLEMLKLGAKIFLETTPATAPVGYNDSDYIDRVVSTGAVDPMNHHKNDVGFNYWAAMDGRAAKGQSLKISIPSIKTEIETYLTCKRTQTVGRCENADMIWQDPQHYSDWGKGQARYI